MANNTPIVRLLSWGISWGIRNTWPYIIHDIAKGQSFGIWYGRWSDRPPTWREGRCALKVKVGKKRKLVRGHLTLECDGRGDDGRGVYSYRFTPTRARILTRHLHPALYEHIID